MSLYFPFSYLRQRRFLYGHTVSKIPRLLDHYHSDMCRIVIDKLNFPWLKFPVSISRDAANTKESGMELKCSGFILYHGVSN